MPRLACYEKHRKSVCDKCDAGTHCTKCCRCIDRKRGRPKKVAVPISPEHAAARVDLDETAVADDEDDDPVISVIDSTTQAQILKVLEAMGSRGHETFVRRLPSVEIRQHMRSDDDVDISTMNRIEKVFVSGILAWARMLVPNWNLKNHCEVKKVFSLKSILAPLDQLQVTETDFLSDDLPPSATTMLTSITSNIRDALKCEKRFTSLNARRLLVPLADAPRKYVASLLTLNLGYVKHIMFQAKVDKLYLSHGLNLQNYAETHSRVSEDSIHYVVNYVYSNDNICRLAWQAKKRAPNKDLRWKDLKNIHAMKSLVLRHDISTMYKVYLDKHTEEMPGKKPVGRTLFYDIVNHITGGGKHHEARAGVDYIKVNFHKDNFVIVDKVIDVLAPLADVDHSLRDTLYSLRSDAYTFLNYCYGVHVREGVNAFDAELVCLPMHHSQEHDVQQFRAYQKLNELVQYPDRFVESSIQQQVVNQVRSQLSSCAKAVGVVLERNESISATTHSPGFSLDLVPDKKPSKEPKPGGRLECCACRGPYLFYDKLRHVALSKLDEDPSRLAEISDALVTIHQCERRSYRYMAHVMQAAHQEHRMKQAMAEMDSKTAYLVFDFKQKFLAKGFREGGDSYYGKKGMLWWGAGVHVKSDTDGVHDEGDGSRDEKLHVVIDFTANESQSQQHTMQLVNEVNVDDEQDESDEDDVKSGEECVEGNSEQDQLDNQGENCDSEQDVRAICKVGFVMRNVQGENEIEENTQNGGENMLQDEIEDDASDKEQGCITSEQVDETDEEKTDSTQDKVNLHFIDCIVEGEQKADANVVLSCLEAAFRALKLRFPHVEKIIVQSDNAKNLAGRQTKLFLPHVCSASGLKLVAYFHNEAQSGKDVCDTHFSHQQTHVDNYLVQGEGGRKVSTPKQLAVALMENPVRNSTVLLVKLDFKAPYRFAVIPTIMGISDFYAAQYVTTMDDQKIIRFYNSLGQMVPSKSVSIPSCQAVSMTEGMGSVNINFTGVTVLLNSDDNSNRAQAQKYKKRYKRSISDVSKREKLRKEMQSNNEKALDEIRAIYPQCAKCLYHFRSPHLLEQHVCNENAESQDAINIAMKHADQLLARMDFSIAGAIDQSASMFLGDGEATYATFEPNFYAGWAHTKKNMHPELSFKVTNVIQECWKAGDNKEHGNVKISADGVYARLDEMQLQKAIRLSELPLPGKIRAVYQRIGSKPQAECAGTCKKRGRPRADDVADYGTKKAKVSYQDCDLQKDLTMWTKLELQAYLCHHSLKKTGNKPELIIRTKEHMDKIRH